MTFKTLAASALAVSSLALAACGGAEEADVAEETSVAEAAPEASETAPEQSEPDMIEAPEGSLAAGEMSVGDPDAPLTVIEYASVTCPGCAAFHAQAFPRIKEELIDTGKMRLVYREFPTPPIRYSQAGFIVARCAATEAGSDAYFAMVDAMYRTQRNWVYGDDPAGALRGIAAQAGIDEQEFDNCFRRDDIRSAIISSVEQGRESGITSTPSFVIDGEQIQLRGSIDDIVATLTEEAEKRAN